MKCIESFILFTNACHDITLFEHQLQLLTIGKYATHFVVVHVYMYITHVKCELQHAITSLNIEPNMVHKLKS